MRGPVTKDSRVWRIFLSSHSIAYLYTFHCLSNCYTWVRKAVVYQGTESPFSPSSTSRDHVQLHSTVRGKSNCGTDSFLKRRYSSRCSMRLTYFVINTYSVSYMNSSSIEREVFPNEFELTGRPNSSSAKLAGCLSSWLRCGGYRNRI